MTKDSMTSDRATTLANRGAGRGAVRQRRSTTSPRQPFIGPSPPPSPVAPVGKDELGSAIHQIVLPILSGRLWVLGLDNDFELTSLRGGSKNIASERPGRVDLALFMPDHMPGAAGKYLAGIYELKPDNPGQYKTYQAEVDSYLEYFPHAHSWHPKHHFPLWPLRTWAISRARRGPSLSALGSTAVFDPIVIEDEKLSVRIDFGPASGGADALIVYRLVVHRRRPGEPSVLRARYERTLEVLRVQAQSSLQARMPVMIAEAIIGGSVLVWAASPIAYLVSELGGAVAAGVAGAVARAAAAAAEAVSAMRAAAALQRLRAAVAAMQVARTAAQVSASYRVRIAAEVIDTAEKAAALARAQAVATAGVEAAALAEETALAEASNYAAVEQQLIGQGCKQVLRLLR